MPAKAQQMPELRELQHRFMAFLQAQDDGVADFVTRDETLDAATRLEIYRNAYSIRLTKSIETDHPELGRYLGDDLFKHMASGYICKYPSAVSSLRDFGERLPDYLACTEPFSDNPILAEIALFERKLLFAFDAADASRARIEDLQAIPPQAWPGMRVAMHPSVCTFAVRWNSIESWQALKEGRPPPTAAQTAGQSWVLWRGVDRLTQFRKLSPEGEVMLAGLVQDRTFSEVCELLLELVAEEQVSSVAAGLLLHWVEAGIISAVQRSPTDL
jgi:hypothetical protein